MNCRFSNKQVKKSNDYDRGVNSGVDSMMLMFTYVLSRYGYKGARIQQIVKSIEDVADSINKGYMTHQDIDDILWDEYKIRMKKRKEWLQGSLDDD